MAEPVSRLTRHFVLLRALRWLPVGLVLPFLVITPEARGLSLTAIGAALAVHSAVAILLEVPSGALADTIGRRRVLLAGAVLTAASLLLFAVADALLSFMASFALLAAGRALISGSLEAWYVDSLRALDPAAPLSHGLSRGTAAEGLAMAVGALAAGGLVVVAGDQRGDPGLFSGYGVAAMAGAVAALAYLAAVAVLVEEPSRTPAAPGSSIAAQTAAVLRTARREATSSVAVRVVVVTAIAWGMSFTAVELLWQPRLDDLTSDPDALGLLLGLLTAASMLAVAAGAWSSTAVNRRFGLWLGYLLALGFGALCIALLGLPDAALPFAVVYLLAYLALGVAEPMHFELLNEAVGSEARATLISAESLATQSGSLTANLGVGALATAHGAGTAWLIAGAFLAVAVLAVARPLRRVAYASSDSSRRTASTDRSTSSSAVDQFDTEMRM
jgi:MFS transporter, DHA1 family, tetracycline resistance protein